MYVADYYCVVDVIPLQQPKQKSSPGGIAFFCYISLSACMQTFGGGGGCLCDRWAPH